MQLSWPMAERAVVVQANVGAMDQLLSHDDRLASRGNRHPNIFFADMAGREAHAHSNLGFEDVCNGLRSE